MIVEQEVAEPKEELRVFAIRQKSTGLFLPMFRKGRGQGRGFSFDKPSNGLPRLHPTRRRAEAVLRAWLEGTWENACNDGELGPEYIGAVPTRVEGRNKEDMEVVPIALCVAGGDKGRTV